MKLPISQNVKRWLTECVCTALGLMILDGGRFVIVQTAVFLVLEVLLLFLSAEVFLRKFWVPISVCALLFFGLSILDFSFRPF